MVYVTGDTHGVFSRFSKFKNPFSKKKDYLIVCGDFGFIWDGSIKEKKILSKIEKLRCTVLFIEGTHDNIDLLKEYPLVEFCGGEAREIAKNLFWLQRGNIFTIEEKTFFAMGGGESHDADERILGESWWKEEMPSFEELEKGARALEYNDNKVDFIITHQNPRVEIGLVNAKSDKGNYFSTFLEELYKNVNYTHWYLGGEHKDKLISGKLTTVFEKIIEIKQ